ncbi:MAG: flagellar biosynthetic protein FliO [Methylohalobius sp.]|nr:flagellar biosynthetic protein FliO [Methylohalobius sp.]
MKKLTLLGLHSLSLPAWAGPGVNPAATGQWWLGLTAVLVVMVLGLWLLKRLSQWSLPGTGQIRILGGLSLGGRERLIVVEVGQTQLILGVAPGRVQTLHVLVGEQRLAPTQAPNFKQILVQRWRGE